MELPKAMVVLSYMFYVAADMIITVSVKQFIIERVALAYTATSAALNNLTLANNAATTTTTTTDGPVGCRPGVGEGLPGVGDGDRAMQRTTATYLIADLLCIYLPGFAVGLLCGAWSDRHGRKLPLLLPPAGHVTSVVVYLCAPRCSDHLLAFVVLGALCRGLTGKGCVSTAAVSSLLCDTVPKAQRSASFAVLIGSRSIGISLGALATGILQNSVDNQVIMVISQTLQVFNVVLVLVFVKETVGANPDREDGGGGMYGACGRVLRAVGALAVCCRGGVRTHDTVPLLDLETRPGERVPWAGSETDQRTRADYLVVHEARTGNSCIMQNGEVDNCGVNSGTNTVIAGLGGISNSDADDANSFPEDKSNVSKHIGNSERMPLIEDKRQALSYCKKSRNERNDIIKGHTYEKGGGRGTENCCTVGDRTCWSKGDLTTSLGTDAERAALLSTTADDDDTVENGDASLDGGVTSDGVTRALAAEGVTSHDVISESHVVRTERVAGSESRCLLAILLTLAFMGAGLVASQTEVVVLSLSAPNSIMSYAWYGYLCLVYYGASGLGLLVLVPCFRRLVPAGGATVDCVVLVFCLLSVSVCQLWTGLAVRFSQHRWQLFAAYMLGAQGLMCQSAVRSLTSQRLTPASAGKVMAAISVLENVGKVLGPVYHSLIYAAALPVSTSLVYYVISGEALLLLPLVLLLHKIFSSTDRVL